MHFESHHRPQPVHGITTVRCCNSNRSNNSNNVKMYLQARLVRRCLRLATITACLICTGLVAAKAAKKQVSVRVSIDLQFLVCKWAHAVIRQKTLNSSFMDRSVMKKSEVTNILCLQTMQALIRSTPGCLIFPPSSRDRKFLFISVTD